MNKYFDFSAPIFVGVRKIAGFIRSAVPLKGGIALKKDAVPQRPDLSAFNPNRAKQHPPSSVKALNIVKDVPSSAPQISEPSPVKADGDVVTSLHVSTLLYQLEIKTALFKVAQAREKEILQDGKECLNAFIRFCDNPSSFDELAATRVQRDYKIFEEKFDHAAQKRQELSLEMVRLEGRLAFAGSTVEVPEPKTAPQQDTFADMPLDDGLIVSSKEATPQENIVDGPVTIDPGSDPMFADMPLDDGLIVFSKEADERAEVISLHQGYNQNIANPDYFDIILDDQPSAKRPAANTPPVFARG